MIIFKKVIRLVQNRHHHHLKLSSSSEALSNIHYPTIAAPLPLWHYFPPAWGTPGGGKHFYFYLSEIPGGALFWKCNIEVSK